MAVVMLAVSLVALSCGPVSDHGAVDRLNDAAYSYHFRSLDSTYSFASRALSLSSGYPDGSAEALNNLAFVSMAHMRYADASSLLDRVLGATDNQIELLVANVQLMRLCQRRSDNKNFYHYRQQAISCMRRIDEDRNLLSDRQRRRLVYARSEYSIVLSSYLYYVGQRAGSSAALAEIDPSGDIVRDTAQLLSYYYNVGSGGILSARSHAELSQSEFDYLMRCYLLSRQYHYIFWEANSLQALSEHLQSQADRRRLRADNIQEFDFLNVDHMPDSLLAGNLAQRALQLFGEYGDVYQVAGAWRTLSEAFSSIGDYQSALACLDNALRKDTAVNAAPDLVASIREQLSIVYSAVDNKPMSDYNRNIYLDLQERTRQDRQLEARAEQLRTSLHQLDMMIVAVVALIAVVTFVLVYFGLRQRRRKLYSVDDMLEPLARWRGRQAARREKSAGRLEEISEDTMVVGRKLLRYRERNVEQRAKVWLASTVTPLIGRMIHEIKCLQDGGGSGATRSARHEYISQLTDSIDSCNRLLTHWIQLHQGDFQIRVESFPLQRLFDTIDHSSVNFDMRGISLCVRQTDAVVKADPTLTLFMLNTIAENARRYTPRGGRVDVKADVAPGYVEVSISDTGCGMTAEQTKTLFLHNVITDSSDTAREGGHGFGLINCKGIIEKYRKLSSIFSVCTIGVESAPGKGSRFFFRLPKGVVRMLVTVFAVFLGCSWSSVASGHTPSSSGADVASALMRRAGAFADSAYFCNLRGDYSRTIVYADSCLRLVNECCAVRCRTIHRSLPSLRLVGDYPAKAAELQWYRDSIDIDYGVLLDVRNETAVAALALHRWGLYAYNNAVYTQLFRERSADNTLPSYVRTMQKAEANRNVAVILLVLIFMAIFPAYYLLYYRRRMYFHLYVDRINAINNVLDDDSTSSDIKLRSIERIWNDSGEAAAKSSACSCPDALQRIYDDICSSLRSDMALQVKDRRDIELAADRLKAASMTCDRLYVSNNVLDNCLSSLKHETMYFPSRLKQLASSDDSPSSLEALSETASYYRILYTTLISQAVQMLRSVESLTDLRASFGYLLYVLRRKNGGVAPVPVVAPLADGYVAVNFTLDGMRLPSGIAPSALFSPATTDVDFLICCQVMRDMGEFTGARGCGISARIGNESAIIVKITLPQNVWNSLDNGSPDKPRGKNL